MGTELDRRFGPVTKNAMLQDLRTTKYVLFALKREGLIDLNTYREVRQALSTINNRVEGRNE